MRGNFWISVGAGLVVLSATPASAQDTVTQGQWARSLAAALGWDSVLADDASDADVAALLSDSDRISVSGKDAKLVTSSGNTQTFEYDVQVARTGAYLVKVGLGDGPSFVTVDRQPSRIVPANGRPQWVDAGTFALSPGAHRVAVTTPKSRQAPPVGLVSGCAALSPPGGWKPTETMTFADKAATLVRALDLRSRLPAGAGYDIPGSGKRRSLRITAEGEFSFEVQAPSPEPVTVRVDGCQAMVASQPSSDGWTEAGSVTLRAGDHVVELSRDVKLRLLARKADGATYVAALESLGVKEGEPTEAVTPRAARDNISHLAVQTLLARLTGRPAPRHYTTLVLPSTEVPDVWETPISPTRPEDPIPKKE